MSYARSTRSLLQTWTVAALLLLAYAGLVHGASVTYEHDLRGRLTRATFDDGTIVEYFYDSNGNQTATTVTTVPADTTPPSASGTPTFTSITASSVTANWTAASDDVGVASYEYRLNAGTWTSVGNVLSIGITGLISSSSYTMQVRARDAANNIGTASSAAFTTSDASPPSAPTGLTASAPNSNTVNLSWTASTDNVGVAGYRVFKNDAQLATTSGTSYVDSTVSGSTTYSYAVSAYDAANNASALSSSVSIRTPDTLAPTTPTNLSAAAVSGTQINLTWSGSSDSGGSGLAGYRVYRNGSHIANSASTSYNDAPLSPGTTHSYTVVAYDNAGNVSGSSNTASATTPNPLLVTQNRTSWSWYKALPGTSNPVVSGPAVVTATGGTGGYTYLWERLSGDDQTSVTAATSNSTSWSRAQGTINVSYISVWRCQVQDSSGSTVHSANVTVEFLTEFVSDD